MANAEKTAPLPTTGIAAMSKEEAALAKKYDAGKKYMFELASRNAERDLPVINMVTKRPAPHDDFPPYRNLTLTSQVVWNGSRRGIRYYDGCTSIFVDEQPKEKETIEQLIKQSKKRHFEKGKFGVFGDEGMLLLYLGICSWNGESEFRTRTSDVVFIPVNADAKATRESELLDMSETALQYAKEATETKMRIHASYLEIPTEDYDSGNALTEKEIRTAYRREALRNPKEFIETYGNRSLEVKHYIDKALQTGFINNKFTQNKATWKGNNNVICDISGIKSQDGIAAKLFEFSQLDEGTEFVIQLKSIFDK